VIHLEKEGLRTVEAGTRLTADQLAALAPGDHVTIESGAEVGRPRHTSGTVIRVEDAEIVVKIRGPRGAIYTERYSRRDGYRVGRGNRAALVTTEPVDPADAEQRRQLQRIDRLFGMWRRNRGDVATLRKLHDAIAERLGVR
jgi:hypothetical protein